MFEATATGKHIKDVDIEFMTSGADKNVKYFEMFFKEVQPTSIMMNGSSDSRPTYEGSFAYESLKMIYTQIDESGKPKGNVEGEYDLVKGKGSVGALASLFAMGLLGPSNTSLTPVPIPAAAWLLGSGLIGLIMIRRKFRK